MTNAVVAKSFSGSGKYRSASIVQTARTVIRLLMAVIECVKKFKDAKNPEMFLKSERSNKYAIRTTEELTTVRDCQPYSKFLRKLLSKMCNEIFDGSKRIPCGRAG